MDKQSQLSANHLLETLANSLDNPRGRIEYEELVPGAKYDDMRLLQPNSKNEYYSIRPDVNGGITKGVEIGGFEGYTNKAYSKIDWGS